jgi:hypothetical protein
MTPFKIYEHYGEYESYIISFFIIIFNEDKKNSLSNFFFHSYKA